MKRSLLLAALLVSPLALAVGTGPTYPDDPHNPAPTPGVGTTLEPVQKNMPRATDPRLPDDDQRLPAENQRAPANPADDPSLPGSGSTAPMTPATPSTTKP
ncbi:hypothetical protein [Pseudomonas cremoricolorata]|uniref:hypothetical protein n=1 Tax=Pseudomonas cremoricolorata TaxID=157783 RepID=UPI0006769E07|nr:hypothetical protein [Pseudomonas cremoricolorata]